ncbi:MAG: sigma-70 family RNA polymerase sigma factor [Oscillospiraceae bacterium]|nr:sigma-70 family RNA polymerase sigma factor [Oscillospiraceae bacterium]
MEDKDIVALYFARSEEAIHETAKKYGAYLYQLAWNILRDHGEAEETVSDTYLGAWNAMPPTSPRVLRHFLSRIARNRAFDRLDYRSAGRRGSGELPEELDECIPDRRGSAEEMVEGRLLAQALNRFLATLPERDCALFVGRYYYARDNRALAARFGMTERRVKYRLSRCRMELKAFLEKEGLAL